MFNLRIGYLNYADLATLTANPVATTSGPITYLQNDARGLIFSASSVASQELKGTWGGTAYSVSQLCLWRHNLAYSDTVRLILYPNADWTGVPTYDPGASAAYESGLFSDWGWGFTNRYFDSTSCKSFKITVAASAAAFQCSRLFLGPYTEAPINPAYGFKVDYESNAKQGRSESGSLRSIRKAQWRAAMFDLMVRTEADRAAWSEISRYCDVSRSLIMSASPGVGGTEERDNTQYGKFAKAPGLKLADWSRYDYSMHVLEL